MRSTTPAPTTRVTPVTGPGALWPDTLPMADEDPAWALPEPGPFREPMVGLQVRELLDPALFERLFGRDA